MNATEGTEPNTISTSMWQSLPVGLFVIDSNNAIVEANDRLFTYFNLPREQVKGRQFGDVFQCEIPILGNAACGTLKQCKNCLLRRSVTSVLTEGTEINEIDLCHSFIINGRKAVKWFTVNAAPIIQHGERYALVAMTDISIRKKRERELVELGVTDALTGLFNRRFILQQLESLLYYGEQSRLPISIAMIDIDGFKQINDTLGHPRGDQVLVGLADILTKNTRDTDYLGRLGGDEFLLIFEMTNALRAQNILTRISKRFKLLLDWPYSPTFSAGVIEIGVRSAGKTNIDQLIQRADDLLYQAKRNGKNRIAV